MRYAGMLSRVSGALRYLLRGEMPGFVQTVAVRRVAPEDHRCQSPGDWDKWRCSNRFRYRVSRGDEVISVCGVHRNFLRQYGWFDHVGLKEVK